MGYDRCGNPPRVTALLRPMPHNTYTTRLSPAASAAAAALALALPALGSAQVAHSDARATGMGDAFVVGNSNGAIYNNPAGILTAPVYSIAAGYAYQGDANAHSAGASIVDAKTNPWIAAGFAYSFAAGAGPTDEKVDDIRDHSMRVALAAPIVPRVLSLGISANYLNFRTGFNDDRQEALRARGATFDAGIIGTVGGRFSVGFAAQNTFSIGDVDAPRRFLAGGGVFLGPLHFEAQYVTAEKAPEAATGAGIGLGGGAVEGDEETVVYGHGFNAGLEFNAGPVPLRVGAGLDPRTGESSIGAGFGMRSDFAGFDIGYRQNLASGRSRDRNLVVAILIFL